MMARSPIEHYQPAIFSPSSIDASLQNLDLFFSLRELHYRCRECSHCGKILPDCEIEVPGISKRRSKTLGKKNRRTRKSNLREIDTDEARAPKERESTEIHS
ncbi:hypothetical protein ACJRO7_012978 [Eucalyptus globulus]|uniref:Uncharacterized protein n=1 Tax=Eucalyptus globulus TaxID=34317 RepID=A0ABD3LKH1_EUCGL